MNQIDEAIRRLRNGEVVGIPTETVYGLAARISDPAAIKKIFTEKERPFFDPLIVHVSNFKQAQELVAEFTPAATVLAKAFWPGPLTLVLKKKSGISDVITSGLTTVGVRCPNHPVTLDLLERFQEPLAAPSANKFGKTSPTKADHVRREFGKDIFVVDGGDCKVGIESTIAKVEESENQINLTILRAGMITPSQLRSALMDLGKKVELFLPSKNIEAPGQIEHHYMPSIPLFYLREEDVHENIKQLIEALAGHGVTRPVALELSPLPELAARELYGKLRNQAETGADAIYFMEGSIHTGEQWSGIVDRLYRAATYRSRSVQKR